ncbi:MAG: cardiolipin synthase [Lachnospiraceae bacterium]|nr:cardiolipin synthase [Lachnospiraceae bacterium]
MNKRWFRTLFRQRVIIALLIVIQTIFLVYVITNGSLVSQLISHILTVISFFVVLAVIEKKDKGSYKIMWVFLILSFPILGGLLYLLANFQSSTRKMQSGLLRIETKTKPLFLLPGSSYDAAKMQTGAFFPQIRYLQDFNSFPVYENTATTYLSLGEKMLDALIPELEKAQKYIFLEFFIVQEGIMWNSILEILKKKAAQGVKIRLLYDDIGCFLLLPVNYPRQLAQYGIECVVFNPFRPLLTTKQNNRDHRKIIVIDGKVAFTGGINLADEYINAIQKHGHWKDSAIMLEGKAAWSFTIMFLQMWEYCKGTDESFTDYYPWSKTPCTIPTNGYIQPYTDSPMDSENVGEHVYLQILNQAKDYVYINTPYLIIDDSMISALCLAAKRGVDVRIVTPHQWDKWLIHMTTRSYYRELVRSGVKIYEYSKGFLHAKSSVSDDCIATIGTINMDFRSLYLHFECGVWMWKSTAVMEIKQDFLNTLDLCQKIEESDCDNHVVVRLFQNILRLFAPLM